MSRPGERTTDAGYDYRDVGPPRALLLRWFALPRAALILDVSASALRRRVERAAELTGEGVLEAHFDGIRARKFGRSWRLLLGAAWLPDPVSQVERGHRDRARHARRPKHATGSEKV